MEPQGPLIKELRPIFIMAGAIAGGMVGLYFGTVIAAAVLGIAIALLAWLASFLILRAKAE